MALWTWEITVLVIVGKITNNYYARRTVNKQTNKHSNNLIWLLHILVLWR